MAERRSQRSTAGVHSNVAGLPVSANLAERLRQLDLDDGSEDEARAEIVADAEEDPAEAELEAEVLDALDREGDPGDEYSPIVFYADEEDEDDVVFGTADDDNEDEDEDTAPTTPSRSPPRHRRRTLGTSPGAAARRIQSAVGSAIVR